MSDSAADVPSSVLRDAFARDAAARGGDLPAGTILGGDFRIERELGRGGMGVVYEATQVSLGRTVAVKVLAGRFGMRAEAFERFRREATTAARLRHRGIVDVLQVGDEGGVLWFAMPRVDGTSLDRLLARLRSGGAEAGSAEGELAAAWAQEPVERACALVAEVAEALHHAHEAGVVHRDVKPGNVLLWRDGTPALGDFGLARSDLEPALTRSGEVAGTPKYMAPEQVRGERDLDRRTDVYALGVTLFEALTLRCPFEAANADEILHAIRTEDAPAPRAFHPALPADLDTIVQTAMARERERRYATAAELAADLRRFLGGEPIRARPIAATTRALRWVGRHRAATAAVVLPALLLVVGSIAFGVVERRAANTVREAAAKERAATEQEAQSRAESFLTSAKALMERGKWREAIENLHWAEGAGYRDAVEVLLLRAEAFAASFESEPSLEILSALQERSDLGRHEAKLLLLLATSASNTLLPSPRATDQLEKALSLGTLDDADAEYARAVLGKDVAECLAHCDRCLALQPAHQGAAALRATLLMALGEPSKALEGLRAIELLCPDNPMADVYQIACLLFLGEDEAAEQRLTDPASPVPGEVRDFLVSLQGVLHLYRKLDKGLAAEGELRLLQEVVPPSLSLAASLMRLLERDPKRTGLRLQAPFPRALLSRVQRFGTCIWGVNKAARAPADSREREEALEDCVDFLAEYPNSLIHWAAGMLRMMDGEWAAAETQFARAEEAPFYVRITRLPLSAKWIAQTNQLKQFEDARQSPPAALLEHARATARRAIELREWQSAQWRKFTIGCHSRLQDLDLADDVAQAWLKEYPNDVEALYGRAEVQKGLLNPTRALEFANRALAVNPNHAGAAKVRDWAVEQRGAK